jgi:hypothetical protein
VQTSLNLEVAQLLVCRISSHDKVSTLIHCIVQEANSTIAVKKVSSTNVDARCNVVMVTQVVCGTTAAASRARPAVCTIDGIPVVIDVRRVEVWVVYDKRTLMTRSAACGCQYGVVLKSVFHRQVLHYSSRP